MFRASPWYVKAGGGGVPDEMETKISNFPFHFIADVRPTFMQVPPAGTHQAPSVVQALGCKHHLGRSCSFKRRNKSDGLCQVVILARDT